MASLLDLLGQTWPARMGQAAWQAFKAPGDAYAGRLDPLSEEGIGRTTDLAGMVMGGTYATAPRGAMGAGPIKAYHGSPYDFERFDLSKIGTGEGAQAYGHGLYFAENPEVARMYREKLAPGRPDAVRPAQEFINVPAWDEVVSQLRPLREQQDALRRSMDVRQLVKDPRYLETGRQIMGLEGKLDAMNDLAVQQTIEKYPHLMKGRMYEVNIRAEPEKFLDWDKPLAQQAPDVRDVLHRVGRNPDTAINRVADEMRGMEFYNALASRTAPRMDPLNVVGIDKPTATSALREAGIPGIRYLDQGSRGGGQGTSNYVLFRDDIIDIVRKYGWAGLAAFGISEEQAKEAGVDKPKTRIGNKSYEM